MYGCIPPHPGPVTAIGLLNANLGVTLALGLVVAISTEVVAGPLFGTVAGRWVQVEPPATLGGRDAPSSDEDSRQPVRRPDDRRSR